MELLGDQVNKLGSTIAKTPKFIAQVLKDFHQIYFADDFDYREPRKEAANSRDYLEPEDEMAATKPKHSFIDRFRARVNSVIQNPSAALNKAKMISKRALSNSKRFIYDEDYMTRTMDKFKARTLQFADRQYNRVSNFFNANRLPIGKTNPQGFKMIKDKHVPGGIRFLATRKIVLHDKDTGEVSATFDKGSESGVYVFKGRKQKEDAARLFNSGKPINEAVFPDSIVTFDKNSTVMPSEFMSVTGQVGNNCEVNFQKGSGIGHRFDAAESTVNVNGTVLDSHFVKANVSSTGNLRGVQLYNVGSFTNNGNIHKAKIFNSSLTNLNHSEILNSDLDNTHAYFSDRNKEGLRVLENSVVNNADLNNALVSESIIDHGQLEHTNVLNSKLNLTKDSYLGASNVVDSQVQRSSAKSGELLMNGSRLSHSTVGITDNMNQEMNNSMVTNGLMLDNNKLVDTNLISSNDHPSLIRNFEGEGIDVNLKRKAAAFVNAKIKPKIHKMVNLSDKNLSKEHELTGSDADMLYNYTGEDHLVGDVQTDQGKISAGDSLRLAMDKVRRPMQRVKMKVKQFFNLHPAPEHEMHKQPDVPEHKESETDYVPSTDVQFKDKTASEQVKDAELDSKIAQAKEEQANSKPKTATYEANQAIYDALVDAEYQDDPIPLDELEEKPVKQDKQQEDAIPLDLFEKQPSESAKQETKEKAPEKEYESKETETPKTSSKPKTPEKREDPKQSSVPDYDPNLASLEGLMPPEESNEPDPMDDMF